MCAPFAAAAAAGFYTPVGVFTVAGLHILPVYLYLLQHLPEQWTQPFSSYLLLQALLVFLAAGRALAMAVEVNSFFFLPFLSASLSY